MLGFLVNTFTTLPVCRFYRLLEVARVASVYAAVWRRWLVGDFVEVILGVKDVAGCGCGETRHSIRGCKPPPVCRFYRLLEVARVASVHAAVWRRWLVGDLLEVILGR